MGKGRLAWTRVLGEDSLQNIWPAVYPQLQRAIDAGFNDFSLESILVNCITKHMQLWLLGDLETEQPKGVLVTSLETFSSNKTALTIILAAGVEVDRWLEHLPILDAFGYENGASEIRILGRPGWKRKLKNYGFKEVSILLRYPIGRRH